MTVNKILYIPDCYIDSPLEANHLLKSFPKSIESTMEDFSKQITKRLCGNDVFFIFSID